MGANRGYAQLDSRCDGRPERDASTILSDSSQYIWAHNRYMAPPASLQLNLPLSIRPVAWMRMSAELFPYLA